MKMSRNSVIAVTIAIVGLVLIGAYSTNFGRVGWLRYGSYEDCVLGEMRGQNQKMISLARAKCHRDFAIPEYLEDYQKFDVVWRGTTLEASETNTFKPDSVTAKLYAKPCGEIDFKTETEFLEQKFLFD